MIYSDGYFTLWIYVATFLHKYEWFPQCNWEAFCDQPPPYMNDNEKE